MDAIRFEFNAEQGSEFLETKGGEKRSEGGGGSGDHVVGRGLEPVCSIHVPVDGPRRTAATFRFARFLFSSPSSFLPADPSPSSESRGEAGARTCRRGGTPPLLRASPFLSFASLPLFLSVGPLCWLPGPSSCSFPACLLWVFSLTAASAPLFFRPGRFDRTRPRLIDAEFQGRKFSNPLFAYRYASLLSFPSFQFLYVNSFYRSFLLFLLRFHLHDFQRFDRSMVISRCIIKDDFDEIPSRYLARFYLDGFVE